MSDAFLQLNDDWRIETDRLNFIICERGVNEKSGDEYYSHRGFYSSLDGVLRACMQREIVSEGDVDDVRELIDRVDQVAERFNRHRATARARGLPETLPKPPPKPEAAAKPPAPPVTPAPGDGDPLHEDHRIKKKKKKKKRSPSRARP